MRGIVLRMQTAMATPQRLLLGVSLLNVLSFRFVSRPFSSSYPSIFQSEPECENFVTVIVSNSI